MDKSEKYFNETGLNLMLNPSLHDGVRLIVEVERMHESYIGVCIETVPKTWHIYPVWKMKKTSHVNPPTTIMEALGHTKENSFLPIEDFIKWTTNDRITIWRIAGCNDGKHLIIPDYIDGLPVVAINHAFALMGQRIESLTLPGKIEYVNPDIFRYI